MKINYKYILPVFLLAASCQKEKLPVAGYMNYVSDKANGLITEKHIGEFKITLAYLPQDYMALNEINVKGISTDKFPEIITKYREHNYFKMRIENTESSKSPLMGGNQGYVDYSDKLQYLAFYGQNDMKLVMDKDTFDCVNYHFENNYNLLPFNDIQMAFKTDNNKHSDMELIWSDVVIGLGRIKLSVKEENINNIPELILQ